MKCENIKCDIIHDRSYGSGKYCSRACANSRIHTKKIKQKISKALKLSSKVKENSRLKRLLNFKKECPICKNIFLVANWNFNKIFCSRKCINYDSANGFKYHSKTPGGYRPGSSRGNCGWYKGIWCDSSWELAFVIYNLDHKIKFDRNNEGFEYEYKNKKHKFYPDFIIDGEYVEIKNYKHENLENKIKYFPHRIKILFKPQIQHMIDYTIKKYGKNYIELYKK